MQPRLAQLSPAPAVVLSKEIIVNFFVTVVGVIQTGAKNNNVEFLKSLLDKYLAFIEAVEQQESTIELTRLLQLFSSFEKFYAKGFDKNILQAIQNDIKNKGAQIAQMQGLHQTCFNIRESLESDATKDLVPESFGIIKENHHAYELVIDNISSQEEDEPYQIKKEDITQLLQTLLNLLKNTEISAENKDKELVRIVEIMQNGLENFPNIFIDYSNEIVFLKQIIDLLNENMEEKSWLIPMVNLCREYLVKLTLNTGLFFKEQQNLDRALLFIKGAVEIAETFLSLEEQKNCNEHLLACYTIIGSKSSDVDEYIHYYNEACRIRQRFLDDASDKEHYAIMLALLGCAQNDKANTLNDKESALAHRNIALQNIKEASKYISCFKSPNKDVLEAIDQIPKILLEIGKLTTNPLKARDIFLEAIDYLVSQPSYDVNFLEECKQTLINLYIKLAGDIRAQARLFLSQEKFVEMEAAFLMALKEIDAAIGFAKQFGMNVEKLEKTKLYFQSQINFLKHVSVFANLKEKLLVLIRAANEMSAQLKHNNLNINFNESIKRLVTIIADFEECRKSLNVMPAEIIFDSKKLLAYLYLKLALQEPNHAIEHRKRAIVLFDAIMGILTQVEKNMLQNLKISLISTANVNRFHQAARDDASPVKKVLTENSKNTPGRSAP